MKEKRLSRAGWLGLRLVLALAFFGTPALTSALGWPPLLCVLATLAVPGIIGGTLLGLGWHLPEAPRTREASAHPTPLSVVIFGVVAVTVLTALVARAVLDHFFGIQISDSDLRDMVMFLTMFILLIIVYRFYL